MISSNKGNDGGGGGGGSGSDWKRDAGSETLYGNAGNDGTGDEEIIWRWMVVQDTFVFTLGKEADLNMAVQSMHSPE